MADPPYWRDRAEEARLMAETLTDPASRQILREIAKKYDDLADSAEQAFAGN
jgi:hypothetical protein